MDQPQCTINMIQNIHDFRQPSVQVQLFIAIQKDCKNTKANTKYHIETFFHVTKHHHKLNTHPHSSLNRIQNHSYSYLQNLMIVKQCNKNTNLEPSF